MNAASFRNVVKTFKSRPPVAALRGVSLDIVAGEVFGLVGPNRAGKTTLMKLLLGLIRPTSGTVERLGRPVSDISTLARVGYMHESQAFPRYLSAREILRYYGGLTGLAPSKATIKADELVARVGIADRAAEPIARYSKGMVQRLALAQSLIADPDLLVLDEPAEGLDMPGKNLLRDVIRERKRLGKTVVLVSHALADVEELCDRVAVIANGALAKLDTTANLRGGVAQTLERALAGYYGV